MILAKKPIFLSLFIAVILVTAAVVYADFSGPGASPPTGDGTIAVDGSSNVGIGTTSPSSKLHVNGEVTVDVTAGYELTFTGASAANIRHGSSNQDIYLLAASGGDIRLGVGATNNVVVVTAGAAANTLTIDSAGEVGIGDSTPSYELEVNGDVAAAAYYYTSDVSLKKDIKPLTTTLDKVLQLQGVTYYWKDPRDPSLQIGLIAQDVEKLFPELVSTSEDGTKYVDYARLTVPLIEAVKGQQKEIDELRAEIERLKRDD